MRNSHPPATVESLPPSTPAEQRYIFDGTYKKSSTPPATRTNRPARPRKRSLFSIITLLISLSVLIIFYIWNKICVNRLKVEIDDIDKQIQRYYNVSKSVEAEISKKSSLERIEYLIDTHQLNLITPKVQPEIFSIDEERLNQLRKKE